MPNCPLSSFSDHNNKKEDILDNQFMYDGLFFYWQGEQPTDFYILLPSQLEHFAQIAKIREEANYVLYQHTENMLRCK